MAKYYLDNERSCNPVLYREGEVVGFYDTSVMGAERFEELVWETRKETGKPCDWHYYAGHATLRAFEQDCDLIRNVFEKKFNQLYNELGPEWYEQFGMHFQRK